MNKKKSGKCLSRGKIADIADIVQTAGFKTGVTSCLIGGAALKLLGVPSYRTTDIDMAASGEMAEGMLKPVDNPNVFSWNKNGHYDVCGVKVDFIHKLSDGTSRLFLAAIDASQPMNIKNEDGKTVTILVAPIGFVAAIRFAAHRKKDIKIVSRLVKRRLVSRRSVMALVAMLAPMSKGGPEAFRYLGIGGVDLASRVGIVSNMRRVVADA